MFNRTKYQRCSSHNLARYPKEIFRYFKEDFKIRELTKGKSIFEYSPVRDLVALAVVKHPPFLGWLCVE